MLTRYDELFCHQIVSTFDHVDNSDRQWNERFWFAAHDNSGEILVDAGIGKYANRNVMDGYGGVAVGGKRQYTVRVSRELWPDLEDLKVGPLSYEIVEPLKKIHICLEENEYGIGFDIEFEGSMAPVEEEPTLRYFRGVAINHTCRYFQLGQASGKVIVEGKVFEIKKETWWAQRDHSWGIRVIGVPPPGAWWYRPESGVPESGLQPFPSPKGIFSHYVGMQFKDWGAAFNFTERPDGTNSVNGKVCYPYEDTRKPVSITDVQHQFEFHPGTRTIRSVELVITTKDGVKREVSVKPLNVYYARAGGYLGGYKGWAHGKWMGPYAIDGEMLDITDQKAVEEVSGGADDTMCEYRCGDDIGYSVWEPLVIGDLPKYGFKG